MVMKIFKPIKNALMTISQKKASSARYRVMYVENDQNEDYVAVIQVVNTKHAFKIKPEEILSDDKMTDAFSQRDIRALTYLGYLGINSPRYKILAQRLSEKDNSPIFALKEKGKRESIIKTAAEISNDQKILKNLPQEDAHTVGFATGTTSVTNEAAEMERLLKKAGKM